jgi:hypothetical protein
MEEYFKKKNNYNLNFYKNSDENYQQPKNYSTNMYLPYRKEEFEYTEYINNCFNNKNHGMSSYYNNNIYYDEMYANMENNFLNNQNPQFSNLIPTFQVNKI